MSIESVVNTIGSIGGAIGNVGGLVNSIRGLTGGSSQSSRYIDLAGQSAETQAQIAKAQANLAHEQWQTYKKNFLPLEKAQAAEAARDLSLYRPLKQAAVAESLSSLKRAAPLESKLMSEAMRGLKPDIPGATAGASAEVKKSFAKVREENAREAGTSGLQPRRAYLDKITDLSQAAAEAAGRTMAARDEKARAEDLVWDRLKQAVSMNKGLPTLSASSVAPAGSTGLGSNTASRVASLLSSAQSGLGQAASTYSQAGRQVASQDSGAFGLSGSSSRTTDLADAWNAASSLFSLFGGSGYGNF